MFEKANRGHLAATILGALVLICVTSCARVAVQPGPPHAAEGTSQISSPTAVTASPIELAPTPSPSPSADPTASWPAYHSADGQFSFKHPATWLLFPENNSRGFVSLGTGHKHTQGPMHVVFDIGLSSWPVTQQLDMTCMQMATVKDSQPVTVQGVTGTRRTGTMIGCQGGQRQDVVEYNFATNGRHYLFNYALAVDAVPVADFDLMVQNTVTFSG